MVVLLLRGRRAHGLGRQALCVRHEQALCVWDLEGRWEGGESWVPGRRRGHNVRLAPLLELMLLVLVVVVVVVVLLLLLLLLQKELLLVVVVVLALREVQWVMELQVQVQLQGMRGQGHWQQLRPQCSLQWPEAMGAAHSA